MSRSLYKEGAQTLGGLKIFTVPVGGTGAGHLHEHHEEVYVVLQGKAKMTVGERTELIRSGQVVFIPPKTWHVFENVGDIPVRGLFVTGKTEGD